MKNLLSRNAEDPVEAVSPEPSEPHQVNQTQERSRVVDTPKRILGAVYQFGEFKAEEPLTIVMMQAFQAGCYKSIACQLYLTVGGGVLGGVLFPVGLIAILLTGAELFTSDSLFMVASFLGGKIHYGSLVRNMVLSWIFNYVGVLCWAAFLTMWSGQLENAGQVDYAIYVAEQKALKPWHEIFLRGIGANFLICLAVWQATTANEVAGKILAIWFPVMAFVIIGFDHCVANMYFITLGMWYGAEVSVVQLLFLALLPATLGNMIGGGFGLGLVYWYLDDSFASTTVLKGKIVDAVTYYPGRDKKVTVSDDESDAQIGACDSNEISETVTHNQVHDEA